jgi:glycosyltransferase involved in cell wall biosynthesis
MACILKVPTPGSKGVVTFTTQERNRAIFNRPILQDAIRSLKGNWVVGLHHNWHDHALNYNPLFDFHMAGEEDLKEVSGKAIPLIPMDACNFVPGCFKPRAVEKFWDVLYVARAIYFKRIPVFFQAIKNLFAEGNKYRVLHICPVPPFKKVDVKKSLFNIREIYDEMFTEEEKKYFTLLTTTYRDPFPFDLPALETFYRLTRVFVHTANEERRCRVAAYAWASGIPVVAWDCVGSVLPRKIRQPPYYYEVKNDEEFSILLKKAIKDNPSVQEEGNPAQKVVGSAYTKDILIKHLCTYLKQETSSLSLKDFALENLDIRLGRHHEIDVPPHGVSTPLLQFIQILRDQNISEFIKSEDPEKEFEKAFPSAVQNNFFKKLGLWK